MTGYGTTLKVTKFKYKICYYFISKCFDFSFLFVYKYFITIIITLNVQYFLKIKNVGEIKQKNINAFF